MPRQAPLKEVGIVCRDAIVTLKISGASLSRTRKTLGRSNFRSRRASRHNGCYDARRTQRKVNQAKVKAGGKGAPADTTTPRQRTPPLARRQTAAATAAHANQQRAGRAGKPPSRPDASGRAAAFLFLLGFGIYS